MANALGIVLGYAFGVVTGQWWMFASGLLSNHQERAANRKAKAERQRELEKIPDRLTMVDVQPDQARTLCLGRVRNVEGIRRRWTAGPDSDKLVMIVSFASHQIDGYEQWYLDDVPVTLDGDGYVTTAPYFVEEGQTDTRFVSFGAGVLTTTATLPSTYIPGTVKAFSIPVGVDEAEGFVQQEFPVTVAGSPPVATVTRDTAGGLVQLAVQFQTAATRSHVRIRPYLGTAGQNVGADLAAEYPGKITANDRFAGIACAVVELTFNPDVFPTSWPSVTPVFRGARCFDPRTSTTAWTENPALLALHYAKWYAGWGLADAHVDMDSVSAAATVCGTSTTYTLTVTGGGTTTVTLPRYRCGIVIAADEDHRQAMDAILETMTGSDGWAGGVWRMRAGALAATAFDMDDSWLAVPIGSDGELAEDSVVTAAQSIPREQRINRVVGKCIDPAQRFQMLPFPAVQDPVLVAAKGERQLEVALRGVNHIAHAQYLGRNIIRQAQAGLRMEVSCGPQAMLAELFDVAAVTLPDYGMTDKTCEVVGLSWGAEGIKLRLREITAAVFDPTAVLEGRDPAPDGDLRRPWDVEQITGVAAESGTAVTTDASIITRTTVTWNRPTNAAVLRGGRIEVQYVDTAAPLPAGDWPSWFEPGDAVRAIIPGLLQGHFYAIRVRAVQQMPYVRGPWSEVVYEQVASRRGPVTFRQASAPAGDVQDHDQWFDTDDGNAHYIRLAGVWVSVRDSAAVNFNARNDRIATNPAAPTVAGDGTAVDHVVNADGSADVSFEWSWGGDEATIDGFEIMLRVSSSSSAYTPGSTPAQEHVQQVPANKRAVFANGVNASSYVTWAVRSFRVVDPDIAPGGIMRSAWVKSTAGGENPYRPASSVAFAGDLTGTIAGIAASQAVVWDATATNFDSRNDRIGTTPVAPTIVVDGTAVDHVINANGSADVSLEWTWSGTESTIDGFQVALRSSSSSGAYVIGTTPAQETVLQVPANKRAQFWLGLSPTAYYTFGVRAYRVVDPDVNAAGVIYSAWVQPQFSENPYRPASSVAFAGDVTGTVAGIPASNVNVWTAITGVNVTTDQLADDAATELITSFTAGPVVVSSST